MRNVLRRTQFSISLKLGPIFQYKRCKDAAKYYGPQKSAQTEVKTECTATDRKILLLCSDIPGCENISMGEGNGCVDIDKMEHGYEILDDDAIVQNVTAMADGETDEEAEKPALMEAHT